MTISAALIGKPNCGKTTIFNAIAEIEDLVSEKAYSTISPSSITINCQHSCFPKSEKQIQYPKIKITDLPSLDIGAINGEGLGNQFLAHANSHDFLIFILNSEVPHIEYEELSNEIYLTDCEKLSQLKKDTNRSSFFHHTISKIEKALTTGISVETLVVDPDEIEILSKINLLSYKPHIAITKVQTSNMPVDNYQISQFSHSAVSDIVIRSLPRLNKVISFFEHQDNIFVLTANKNSSIHKVLGNIHPDLAHKEIRFFKKKDSEFVEISGSSLVEDRCYIRLQ